MRSVGPAAPTRSRAAPAPPLTLAHPLLLALLLPLCGCGPEERTPLSTWVEDWRDEVIYEIVVDRFDNASAANDRLAGVGPTPGDLSRHQGGDWAGVRRRLPYLQKLGVTAIWISPVTRNVDRTKEGDGYHGYWAADFSETNPRFGTLAELQELVRAAHARGIKVILDVVINHTGRLFFYDLSGDGALQDGELWPPYRAAGPYPAPLGWLGPRPRLFACGQGPCPANPARLRLGPEHFHRRGQTSDYSSREQMEQGDFPTGLRDLHTERSDVLSALVQTWAHWVALSDVDGFRLDAVPHVAPAVWAEFARRLRARLSALGKERFLLLGEAWHRDPKVVARYAREGGLDSVFDFALKWEVIDGVILDGKPAQSAVRALETDRGLYPAAPQPGGIGVDPWSARVTFVDNHDMKRIRGELNDPFAAELALSVIFFADGLPCLYYGTEQGLAGRGGHQSREVLWQRGFDQSHRTFRHIARLAELRRSSIALRRGTLLVRHASAVSARKSAPDAGLLAWERVHPQQRVLAAINGHPTDTARAEVPVGFAPGTGLRDGLGVLPGPLTVSAKGTVSLALPPRRAAILLPTK